MSLVKEQWGLYASTHHSDVDMNDGKKTISPKYILPNNCEIFDSVFFTSLDDVIGIVVGRNRLSEVQAYIGCCQKDQEGNQQRNDEMKITNWGAKFPNSVAARLFPYLESILK